MPDCTLSITSLPSGQLPKLLIQVGGENATEPVELRTTFAVLARYAEQLRQGLKNYLKSPNNPQSLQTFAELGHAKLKEICSDAIWCGKPLFGELHGLLSLDIITDLKLTGDIAAFPFELLYVTDPRHNLHACNFVGMKFKVRKSGFQAHRRAYTPNLFEIELGEKCVMGFARHRGLSHTEEEYDRLLEHDKGKVIKLREIGDTRGDPLGKIAAWINEEFCLVHFACHIKDNESKERRLVFHDTEVSVGSFKQIDKTLEKAPFVFLNACQSGPVDITNHEDLAQIIGRRYAVGLLVTESDIPDRFAADFSRIFYHDLFKGATVAHTLHETKRAFMRGSFGASGLAYSLFAPHEIAVVRPT